MEFGNTKAADTVEDALREESQRMTFGEIGDLIDLYLKKADLRDTELFRNKDIEDAYSYVEMFTMKAIGTFGILEDEDGSMDVKLESFEDLISYVVAMKSDMIDIKEDYQLELNELKKELAELKKQHEREIQNLKTDHRFDMLSLTARINTKEDAAMIPFNPWTTTSKDPSTEPYLDGVTDVSRMLDPLFVTCKTQPLKNDRV